MKLSEQDRLDIADEKVKNQDIGNSQKATQRNSEVKNTKEVKWCGEQNEKIWHTGILKGDDKMQTDNIQRDNAWEIFRTFKRHEFSDLRNKT